MATITYNHSDPQQFALYDAEAKLMEHRCVRHYRTAQDAKAFLQQVVRSELWQQLGGIDKITVKVTRHDSGVATCHPGRGLICLPGWGFNSKTILHEMAHLISSDGHGPDFARAALTLYRKFIGQDFANRMAVLYRVHGVNVSATVKGTT